MSSEEFSEKPLPAEQKRCYYCGAMTAARNRICWLCHEKYAIQKEKPCCGTATDMPWGVVFLDDGVARHPTQLYEFVFHIACAAVLVQLQARGVWRGQLIKAYIIAYLTYRFATEFIRPEPRLWLALTVYQVAAMLFAPVFAWLWWRDARAASNESRRRGQVLQMTA